MKPTSGEDLKIPETLETGDTVFVTNLGIAWTEEGAKALVGSGYTRTDFASDLQDMQRTLNEVGVSLNTSGVIEAGYVTDYYTIRFVTDKYPEGFSLDLPNTMISREPVEVAE